MGTIANVYDDPAPFPLLSPSARDVSLQELLVRDLVAVVKHALAGKELMQNRTMYT